jgi:MFS family permease
MSQSKTPGIGPAELHTPDRGIKNTFYALSIRNYRYFWLGNLGSFFSAQMMQPTQAWLAYQITNSPLLLGLTWAAQGIPQIIIAPIGGLVIDRIQKRNLIMITQSATILINLAIAILISTGMIQFWHLLVSCFLSGATNAFNQAARTSLVPELVPRDKMFNAIALNNGGSNLARICGPAVAGVLIGFIGTQGAYYVGIAFNILAIILVSFLPPTSKLGMVKSSSALDNLKEGFSYMKVHYILLILLGLEGGLTIFGMWFQGITPVIAGLLQIDSIKYGFMMSAIGLGSLTGAIGIASLSNYRKKGLAMLGMGVLFGVALILMGNVVKIGDWLNIQGSTYTLMLILMAVAGLASTSYVSTSLTLFQLNISDEMRGRMISMYQMVTALYPFSMLISGAAINVAGAEMILTIGGICMTIFMLAFIIFTKQVRRLE